MKKGIKRQIPLTLPSPNGRGKAAAIAIGILILVCGEAWAVDRITATVLLTSGTTNGQTITVNGSTRTWTRKCVRTWRCEPKTAWPEA